MCVCIYLRISYRVYMCVCVHLRIGTQTSRVSLYVLRYRYAESTYVTYTPTESTRVCIYLRIHAQVWMCVCSCVYTQKLHVYAWMFTYMYAEYMCVCIHFSIYTQRVNVSVYIVTCIHTEFTCVLVCIYVYVQWVYKCICIYLRIYTHRVCLGGCVYIFVNTNTEFTCVCPYSRTWAHVWMWVCI